jgi:hypothetical protein
MRIYLDNCCFNRPFDDQTSEPFDYTEWQRDLYGDMPLDEFYEKVKAVRV